MSKKKSKPNYEALYRELLKEHKGLLKERMINDEMLKTARFKALAEATTHKMKQNLILQISESLKREDTTVNELKDIEKNQKQLQESVQKVKALQNRLKPWVNFIEELTEKAFKHGHSIATFKNVIIGDKILVLKPKTLKSMFIAGIPLGHLFFDDLPETIVKVEELCKELDITTLSGKDKRKMAVELLEEQDKADLRKQGLKELKRLEDFINEQVAKAKPSEKDEVRKHFEEKVESQKQAIREEYGLK